MPEKYNKIGIMNGRLSEQINDKIQEFPRKTWKTEFEKASKCGFKSIEWIFDIYDKNPILNNEGIQEIKYLSQKTDVIISSILADFFMEKKLVNISEFELEKNLGMLKTLIKNSNKLGVEILEIPFVDSSSLTTKNDQSELVLNLQKILPLLDENNIFLTLETDLPPQAFKELILSFNHPKIKANYDVGNSAALGYDLIKEFNIFGNLISNIHIKDRKYHGSTVPLGTGDVNFKSFFNQLQKINYKGNFIIQGAREYDVSPEDTCIKYLEFVKTYVEKYLFDDNKKN